MGGRARFAWRLGAVAAFAATAALAVTLNRGAPPHAALTAAKGSVARHARIVARCATAGLRISLGPDATGVSYPLEFTNVSGVPCTLNGYPEVAAYDAEHDQVGDVAGRDLSVTARRILLAPGQSAHASVNALSAGRCRRVRAAGLRVIPPGQTAPRYVGRAVTVCAAGPRGRVFLRVQPVQPGAG